VSGNLRAHHEAEERFARFAHLSRALLFGSGYAANLGILAALADRDGEVFSDELNHACLIDGARLSKAKVTRFPHRDVDAPRRPPRGIAIAGQASSRPTPCSAWTGTSRRCRAWSSCAEKHDAWLVLDDAHGIGVLGATGRRHAPSTSASLRRASSTWRPSQGARRLPAPSSRGRPARSSAGAARANLRLFDRAAAMAAAVAVAALDLIDETPSIVHALRARIEDFTAALSHAGVAASPSTSAIHPIIVGETRPALDAAALLQERGFLVPAIRPPTVPEGTSRLRVSLSAAHTREEIEALATAMAGCLVS